MPVAAENYINTIALKKVFSSSSVNWFYFSAKLQQLVAILDLLSADHSLMFRVGDY